MKKRLLTIATAAILVFSTAAVLPKGNSITDNLITASAVDSIIKGSCGKNATFKLDLNKGTLTISGTGAMNDYNECAIFYPPWFMADDGAVDKISKVVIENGITHIGDFAFYGCKNLSDVSIPSSVKSIGWYAFGNCENLVRISLSNNIASIGDQAFVGCANLSSITLPNSITKIGYAMFSGCSALKSIVIPNSVTSIGSYAFENCTKLSSISIPSTTTFFGSKVFEGTPWFENKRKSSSLVVINKVLVDGTTCKGNIVIPSGIIAVGDGAFSGNDDLLSVSIPNTTKRIDSDAFMGCENISKISIPSNVTSVGSYAFYGCKNLKEINIPNSVTSIGNEAFNNTQWMINRQKTNDQVIVNGILINAEKVKGKAVISDKVSCIGSGAFYGNDDITEITIPNSVTNIDEYAFWGCSNLRKVSLSSGLKTIGKYAFYCCTSLTEINLPGTVNTIEEYAFYNCDNLKSIKASYGITKIEKYAFSGCTNLTNVSLPNSIKSIESEAFLYCESLKSITIPKSITQIGEYAFGYYNQYDYVQKDGYSENVVNYYKYKNIVISCYYGTAGEKYAKENGFNYTLKDSISISSCKVSIPYSSYTYRGRGIKPSITVKTASGEKLTKGTDYTVSYSNNTNVGTATITVTGKGKYIGTVKKTFTVKPLSLSSSYAKISIPYSSYTYSGSAIKPTVTVKFKDGDVIPSSEYTLSYSNNVKVGVATITIKGKSSNVTGTYNKTFVVKPAKNEITSITSTKGAFKISWKKATAGAVGYQVQYSTDKNFAKNVHSYTSTNLSDLNENFSKYPNSGEIWYVKVRSFYTKDGKTDSTRYGNYSAVKTIKIK